MKKFVFRLCFLSAMVYVVTGTVLAIQSPKAKPNPERIPIPVEVLPVFDIPLPWLSWMFVDPEVFPEYFKPSQPPSSTACYGSSPPTIRSTNLPAFCGERGIRPQIIKQSKARYTDEAREALIVGKVVLAVEFLADGTIGEIRVVRSLGYGLDEQAIEAARQIKFHPAMKDGEAMTYTSRVEFLFQLP